MNNIKIIILALLIFATNNIMTASMMGATKEQKPDANKQEYPANNVYVHDFSIGKYEVTQKAWQQVMGYNPSEKIDENLPVENISWVEAKEFIKRLNEVSDQEYYLP